MADVNAVLSSIMKRIQSIERRITSLEVNEQSVVLACRVERTASAQSISNTTWTAIQFDTEIVDTNNGWSSGDPTKIYAALDGIYVIAAGVSWNANSNGVRRLRITVNGSVIARDVRDAAASGGEVTTLTLAAIIELSSSDYITLDVYQSSGSALNVRAIRDTFLAMARIA